jgi:hypothetical protein
MNKQEAERFAQQVEQDSVDETELPANRRMPPTDFPKGKRPVRLDEQSRIDNAANRIISQLRERINAASEAEQLSQQVAARIGHPVADLLRKAEDEKAAAKAECLLILHKALDWLVNDQKVPDVALRGQLAEAYERGKRDATDQATKWFNEELARVKGGLSPLELSLDEKLGSK